MFTEDDLLPISALQHYVFCPRQCALIHIEQVWAENKFTAQGRQLHDRAHEAGPESRGEMRIVRGLWLCSHELGLAGQADVVELHHPEPNCPPDEQACLPGLDGKWTIHPVEYKRGRSKRINCDRVQLCAQAMCLEEMLHVRISGGSLFYGQPRRRESVAFDTSLRQSTRQAALNVHRMIHSQVTPPPVYSPKCRSCSLVRSCMPKRTGQPRSARLYLRRQLREALEPGATGAFLHEDL